MSTLCGIYFSNSQGSWQKKYVFTSLKALFMKKFCLYRTLLEDLETTHANCDKEGTLARLSIMLSMLEEDTTRNPDVLRAYRWLFLKKEKNHSLMMPLINQ